MESNGFYCMGSFWTSSRAPLEGAELRPTSTSTLMGIISSHIPTEQFPLESHTPRNIPLLLNSMEYSPRVFTAMMPPDPTVQSEGRKEVSKEGMLKLILG